VKKNLNQTNLKSIYFALFKDKTKFILLTSLVFVVVFLFVLNQTSKKFFLQKSKLSYHVVVANQIYIENVKFFNLNRLKLEDFNELIRKKRFYSKFLRDLNSKELFSQFIYLNQKKYNLKFKDLKIAKSFAIKYLKYQEKSGGNRIVLNFTSEIDGVKLLDDYCNYVSNIAKEGLIDRVLNLHLNEQLQLINHLEIAKKIDMTLPLQNTNEIYQHGTIVLSKMIADNNNIIENIKNLNIEMNFFNKNNEVTVNLQQNSKKKIISLSFLVSICISLFIYLIIILFRNKKINF
jgi:hypothetical protein